MKTHLFIIFILLGYITNSQTIIKGIIIDKTGCSITNANIQVKKYSIFTQTDTSGHFSLTLPPNVKKGYISVSSWGYKSKKVLIRTNKNKFVTITLIKEPPKEQVEIISYKPVIYLYPTKETKIDIKLNINGTVLNTYPNYNNGWNVIAKPDGDLINTSDDSRHRYLFWDGKINKSYKIADFNTGFVVPADETLEFLDSTLSKMGLNDYEKNDFITFWLPELKQNKYNFVHFLINDDCNEIATLNITPKPDSEVRIYMLFSAINEPISIRSQHLELLTRNGFTLVEWGGMDFKSLMQ